MGRMIGALVLAVVCVWSAEACKTAVTCVTQPFNLGCYYVNSTNPFCKDEFPPWQPAQLGLRFEFYTPEQSDTPQVIPYDTNLASSIKALDFDPSYPLALVVHGFETGYNATWMITTKDALIQNVGKVNVMLCYWAAGSTPGVLGIDYYQATANTRVVGPVIAQYIYTFKTQRGINLDDVAYAGHSLGAHIGGFAGEYMQDTYNMIFGRIIALDPAGPLYDSRNGSATPTNTRLDPSDAKFVHCIHTNGENLFAVPPGCGTLDAWGHVDFYPNGGVYQPGCLEANADCNHGRSHDLYIDFINAMNDPNCPDVYPAWPAKNYTEFKSDGAMISTESKRCKNIGYNLYASDGCSGKYYFDTTGPQSTIWNVKFTGCQYNAYFEIDNTDYAGGTLNMLMTYSDGTATTYDTSPLWTDDTSFRYNMQRVTTAPCTQASVKSVTIKYNRNLVLHPQSQATIPVKTFKLTDAQGKSYSASGFSLPDNKATTVNL